MKFNIPFRLLTIIGSMWLLAGSTPARGQTQTLRYDLASIPLDIVGVDLFQDFIFPVEPARIVTTRFHLQFNTQTEGGNFAAQDIALRLEPPIASGPGFLNAVFTGAYFGWSGNGVFSFDGETDDLNGIAVPAPEGSLALLYSIYYFNAQRLNEPDNFAPIGGQFIDSWVEVDIAPVPEPASIAMLAIAPALLMRRNNHR